MSRKYTEAEIEKAVKEAMEKVDERGGPQAVSNGRAMVLVTPWGTFGSGAIFKAQTVKGSYNYVVFLLVDKGYAFYCHGDRAKKVPKQNFIDLIENGDLEFVPREKADTERLSLAVLGLNAMTNGLSFNDYMKVYHNYGDGSDASRYS